MENVNKQLLDALVQLAIAETGVVNAKAWSAGKQAKKHCDFALTAIATARQAIAAAGQAQQADHIVEATEMAQQAVQLTRDWPKIEAYVIDAAMRDYVESYEMIGDNNEVCYSPTKAEQDLIIDCMRGLLAESDFIDMLTAQPTAQQQIVATQLVCDALVAIVAHSGDPAGTVAALAEWRKKAEAFTRNPAAQQQAEPVAMSLPFFAYDSETGFERFATEAEAKAAAQESIDAYREEAGEGWAEAVENICWGVVLGTTREVELPDEYSGGNGLADSMKPVDYVLTDAAQPPAVAVPAEWLKNSGWARVPLREQATTVAVPDEREAFEAWLQKNIDDTDTVRPSKEKVDAYFAVWLARAMLAAAQKGGAA